MAAQDDPLAVQGSGVRDEERRLQAVRRAGTGRLTGR